MKNPKNIFRNTENAKLAGVCGAVAEYFGIDAKYIRVIYVVLTILVFFFPGILLYLFLMLLIPKKYDISAENQLDE